MVKLMAKKEKRQIHIATMNTRLGIKPHAAIIVPNAMHDSIYNMNDAALGDMVRKHLRRDRTVQSESTSWSSTLDGSIGCYTSGEDYYLAIVDLCAAIAHHGTASPDVFHVPQLWRAGLSSNRYDHEFLMHGTVSSPGYDYVTICFNASILARVNTFIAPKNDFLPIENAVHEAMDIAKPIRDICAPTTNPGAYIYFVVVLLGYR
jgi:hypothetical protein